jgi:N-acetylneuraminate synthase
MNDRTFIIAEAGVNHNGSLETAKRLVDAAARSGADAVKFQSFKAEKLASKSAPKAAYQGAITDPAQSQSEMLRALELSEDAQRDLARTCSDAGIEFLSTPFDSESARFLNELGVKRFKIGSGDLTNAPLLLDVARLAKPTILSTGMASMSEIEDALSVIAFGRVRGAQTVPDAESLAALNTQATRDALRGQVALLHCTTEYPAPPASMNLRAMETLRTAFGLPVGLSDHSSGIHFAGAAVALGAQIIEKHFTLDRTLPGPDHRASIEPDDLIKLVNDIREIEVGLGSGEKIPDAAEIGNRTVARRSLVAATPIRRGEKFTERNVTVKRPEGGVPPIHFWAYMGRTANRDYDVDEAIDP